MEEKEEAGYRSPTWSKLRALQKINKAKRLEGEDVISAPRFVQSAGRGDLKFWKEDDKKQSVSQKQSVHLKALWRQRQQTSNAQ